MKKLWISTYLVFLLILTLTMPKLALSQTRGVSVQEDNTSKNIDHDFTSKKALIIGINKYRSEDIPSLEFAMNDAVAIKKMLVETQQYDEKDIITLFNEDATKAKILSAFDFLQNQSSEKDKVFIYYAGHGKTRKVLEGVEKGYILPYDTKLEELTSTAISTDQLNEFSASILARHLFFVMDACYGGNILSRSVPEANQNTEALKVVLSSRVARQALTAGGADQEVLDGGPQGHSVFTYHLLSAIENKLADYNKDEIITSSEIAAYLLPAVSVESDMRQTPQYGPMKGNRGGEFFFISPGRLSSLTIDASVENATVFIDGEEVGKTPLQMTLDKGTYKITVDNNNLAKKDSIVILNIDTKLYFDLTVNRVKNYGNSLEKSLFTKQVNAYLENEMKKGNYLKSIDLNKTLYRLTNDEAYLNQIIQIQNSNLYKKYLIFKQEASIGNLKECRIILDQLEQLEPLSTEIKSLRIELTANPRSRIKQYEKLLKTHAEDQTLLIKYAENLIIKEQNKKALSTLNTILNINPNNAYAYFLKGKIYMQNEKSQAINNFNSVNVHSDTINAENYFYLIKTYLEDGNLKMANETLDEAFSYGLRESRFLYLQGLIQVENKQFKDATKILASSRNTGLSEDLIKELENKSEATYRSAISARDKKDDSTALLLLEKSVTFLPSNYDGFILRSEIYYQQDQLTLAFVDLQDAIKIDPDNLIAYKKRRDYNLRTGNYESVIHDCENIMAKSESKDLASMSLAGISYFHLGNYEQAAIGLKKCVSAGIKQDSVYYYLSCSLTQLQKNIPALKTAQKGIKENKFYHKLHFQEGEAYMRLKKYDAAYKSFKESNRLNPNSKSTLFMLGLACELQEKHSKAIVYFQDAKYLDAMDPSLLIHLGYNYNKDGDEKEALAHYEMAYMADPSVLNGSQFCTEIGYLYLDREKYDKAEFFLSEAVKQNPGNWAHKLSIAELYAYQGLLDKSLAVLEEVLVSADISLYDKIKKSKYFEPIRSEKRFRKLVKSYK